MPKPVEVTISDAGLLAIQAECKANAGRNLTQYHSIQEYVQYIISLDVKRLIATYETETAAIDSKIAALQKQKADIGNSAIPDVGDVVAAAEVTP